MIKRFPVLGLIRFLFLLGTIVPLISNAQKTFDFSDSAITSRIKHDVYVLASDSFMGREAGTEGEIKSRNFILQSFMECGLQPLTRDTSMIFPFVFKELYDSSSIRKASDVIGYIDNKALYTVVIGAHYDHLGNGNIGALDPGNNSIHYGADDNASGTAGVMELARYLKANGRKDINFILCAFSAEEEGLYGSLAFVKSVEFDSSKITCMLDLDMVGRLGAFGNVLFVNSTKTSSDWNSVLKKAKPKEIYINKIPAGLDGSDHQPFYKKGIPVLFFITGLHKDYHTSRDIPSKINYKGETAIVNYIEKIISSLDSSTKMKFRKPTIFHKISSNLKYLGMLLNR